MRYRGSLTIEAGKTEADPATETIKLCYGDITEVEVGFQAGCGWLVHLQIWHWGQQIFPLTGGASFIGDDQVIEFAERWPIHELPYEIELRGWAPDASYDHTVSVEITVSSPEGLDMSVWRDILFGGMAG